MEDTMMDSHPEGQISSSPISSSTVPNGSTASNSSSSSSSRSGDTTSQSVSAKNIQALVKCSGIKRNQNKEKSPFIAINATIQS